MLIPLATPIAPTSASSPNGLGEGLQVLDGTLLNNACGPYRDTGSSGPIDGLQDGDEYVRLAIPVEGVVV